MDYYRDKARGMFVGLAIGDALGAPIEFGYSSYNINRLGDKISHFFDSPRGKAGEWTDDTAMSLCIADSLLENHGYDSYDIMDKFYRWVQDGYRSHNGLPADDVGDQTRIEIIKYHRTPIRKKDEPKTQSAGNAPIMRLAPIVIANCFFDSIIKKQIKKTALDSLINMAILSCREDHNSIAAEYTTQLFASLLYSAFRGYSKSYIQNFIQNLQYKNNEYSRFEKDNQKIIFGRAFGKGEDLKDLGTFIVDAFTIALWGFIHSESFEEGMLKVLRLGGDADTNAACYGQIAGTYYGYEAIPEEWRKNVYLGEEITDIADELFDMDKCPVIRTRFEDNEYFSVPGEKIKAHIHETSFVPDNDNIQSIGEILKERFHIKNS